MADNDISVPSGEWHEFLEMVHGSNAEFARGEIGKITDRVWSHGDDVTIFGGYGGVVEPGWNNVQARLTAAAAKAANGTYASTPIKSSVKADSAYILQLEHYSFPEKPVINIRATIICQKEPDGWKIVHRHGEIIG